MKASKGFLLVRQTVALFCLFPGVMLFVLGTFTKSDPATSKVPGPVYLNYFFWLAGTLLVLVIMARRGRTDWYANAASLVCWAVLAAYFWLKNGVLPGEVTSPNDLFSLWVFWTWPAAVALDLIAWFVLRARSGWQGFSGGEYQA